jgi:competence protein ComEA
MNGLKGLRGYIGLSLVWVAVLGAALFFVRRPSSEPIEILPPPTLAPTAAPSATSTPGPLRIDVAGAVASPGIYTLARGSLVADAVAAAGGPAADADLDRINKAMPLQDTMQVFVPRVAQPIPKMINPPASSAPAPVRSGQTAVLSKPVNLNTATLDELDTLPGVGPATAQRIVEGRPYGAVEDLMRVKGIGQATFDKLKDLVTVR